MILLVTSSRSGSQCVEVLEKAMGEGVHWADTVRKAAIMLRSDEYSAIILDGPMVECDLDALDSVLNNAGMAIPVYVNLAITGAERLIREVRHAMRRHAQAKVIALRAAESLLRSEIRDAVTGILLSTELALRSPELPLEAEEKLQSVCYLASQIRSRLETVQ